MEEFKKNFPIRLKMCLDMLNVTQSKLAEICGVSAQTVGEWVNGDCLPSLPTFRKICVELHIDPNALLGIYWKKPGRKKNSYELKGLTD